MTTVEAGDHAVAVTHGDRVVFPAVGATKRDVIDYYARVAGRMLPHLRDRPLVLRRFPQGLAGDGFFQKQAPAHTPDWIRRAELARRGGGSVEHLVVCDDPSALVYLANQGTVEVHTLLARAGAPDHPDQLVLDLDPSTDDRGPVVAAARAVRAVLAERDLPSFVKATGSRGVHVHVPLDGTAGVDRVRDAAHALARAVVARDPGRFTVEFAKADRGDRLFVDWLRNGHGQHAVAPYSLRARPTAPVAGPMDWDEVTSSSFDPQAFTLANVFRRLAQKSDPWAAFGHRRVDAAAIDA